MAGEPLTPEEQARLATALQQRGSPGVVTYDPQPVTLDGGWQAMPPTPPPAVAPGAAVPPMPPAGPPLSPDAQRIAEIEAAGNDAFAASRGAAQQARAEAAARTVELSPREQWLQKHPEARSAELGDGPAPPPPAGAAPAATTPDAGPPPAHPPSPGVFVPGGWQNHSRTGRLDVPQDVKDDVGRGLDLSEQAVEAGAKAGTERADAEAARLTATERQLHGMDNYVAQAESNRQAAMERAQIHLEELSAKVAKQADEAPQSFYAKRGTLPSMMALFGVALSGLAAGMRGGTNQALDMYEKTLDRDLEQQRMQAAAGQQKVANARGILGQMKENFGDARQAEAAAKYAYLQRAEVDLKALAAQSQSKETQARATELLAGIQERRAQWGLKFAELEQGKLNEVYRPAQVVGGGGPKADPEKNKLFIPTGPNGEGYFAKTEEEAKKIRALRTAVASVENVVNEGTTVRANTGYFERGAGATGVYETPDYTKLNSYSGQMVGAVKEAEQLGALDKGSSELAGKIGGDFASWRGNPEVAAGTYLASLKRKLAETERSQAGQGARQVIANDAQGQPVAVQLGQASMASPRAQMPTGFKPIAGPAPTRVDSPQKFTAPSMTLPAPAPVARKRRKK